MEFLEFFEFSPDSALPSFNFAGCDFQTLDNALREIDWEVSLGNFEVAECFKIFKTLVLDICSKHVPIFKCVNYKFPWCTKKLKHHKNLRNKFFKKFKLTNEARYYDLFILHRNKFRTLNKSLYKEYIHKFELNIKSNPKNFWRYIKSIKKASSIPNSVFYRDETACSVSDAANLFADFFSSIFVSDEDIQEVHLAAIRHNFLGKVSSSVDFGSLVLSDDDVIEGLLKIKNSAHSDVDGLSVTLFKNCRSLVQPLKLIFNKSLAEGIFIDDWKLTSVTPIFKSGNKSDIANYRPISKLSAVSKLFECIVKDKVYFSVKHLISPRQHAFVAARSTLSNLSVFTDDCHAGFQNGFQTDAIYTDFSKAFDKISHTILVTKLACLGFHSTFLDWIRSYLIKRCSTVVIDGVSSKQYTATSGVPQGSILGPLFFVLFINDICSCFSFANFLLYADDLKVYAEIRNSSDSAALQSELNNLFSWCLMNRLFLNIEKCHKISFSKLQNPLYTSYHINYTYLASSDVIKDLGVFFDSKLNFISHLNYVVSNSLAMLAFVRRHSSHFSDPYTLKILYYAFVRSKLDYASFIWRPYHAVHINRLERVQKIFVRFALHSLNFSDPKPSYDSRCRLISLFPLSDRGTFQAVSFIFDLINGQIDCPVLLERIQFNVPSRNLRRFKIFRVGGSRTLYSANAPLVRTLSDLNYLASLLDIDFSRAKYVFQTQLKNYFLCKKS